MPASSTESKASTSPITGYLDTSSGKVYTSPSRQGRFQWIKDYKKPIICAVAFIALAVTAGLTLPFLPFSASTIFFLQFFYCITIPAVGTSIVGQLVFQSYKNRIK
ncbi:MAG: hypothetical protein K1000chlam4_00076 [Chlamydiae bacterium]|nr:hypothetical protein [Chlamydiota bacterium]